MVDKNYIKTTLENYYKAVSETLNENEQLLYIGVYGSQNYNLSDKSSDVDAVAIIIPTDDDIILSRKQSKELHMQNGAHVTVKDLASFIEETVKCSSYTFEVLETEFHYPEIVENKHFQCLFDMKNRIFAHNPIQLYRTLWSIVHNNFKRIDDNNIIADSKKVAAMLRALSLMEDMLSGKTYGEALRLEPEKAKYLLYIKRFQQDSESLSDEKVELLKKLKYDAKEKADAIFETTVLNGNKKSIDAECLDLMRKLYVEAYKAKIRGE